MNNYYNFKSIFIYIFFLYLYIYFGMKEIVYACKSIKKKKIIKNFIVLINLRSEINSLIIT
jgi:hypothetical protein